MKKPRLKGPLVLSEDGFFSWSNKLCRFSTVSKPRRIPLTAITAVRTPAYSRLTSNSHSVLARVASKSMVEKR